MFFNVPNIFCVIPKSISLLLPLLLLLLLQFFYQWMIFSLKWKHSTQCNSFRAGKFNGVWEGKKCIIYHGYETTEWIVHIVHRSMRIVQTNLIHTNETIHTYYVWWSFHVKLHEWILSRFSLSRKNVQNIDWPIFQKCPCLIIVVRFSLTTSSLIHTQTWNGFIHRNFIH